MARYAGIEGGGTKFVVAFGTGPDDLTDPVVLPTTTPGETLGRVIAEVTASGPVDAVGIASFGPLDLRPGSPAYGSIAATPKEGWSATPVLRIIEDGVGTPVGIDTDVTAAALAERRWGAASGLDDVLYITVGTGIGGGAVVAGRPLHGANHPEMGHLRVSRRPDDRFEGVCPFHRDCLEGMASGPAIAGRWGRPAGDLGTDTAAAVVLEAWYLGAGLANLAFVLAPQRIVVGGGVMGMPGLYAAVRDRFRECLAGYVQGPEIRDAASFIVGPGLGDRAGVLGAIQLAGMAAAGE